ncbi:MAG TPA: 3-carboxy-cis,cis-muconate cycloisomerase, partial [Rubrobacteraceae bacterium]|nr:3-carboxy-cis,cis-muconate cycloisomerase [Rubrobacteraceae bacterium]
LDITRGLLLSENITTVAAQKLGRLKAHDIVEAAAHRARDEGKPLREVLLQDTELREVLSEGEIDTALDPARYLGSAGEFVDRALKLYRQEVLA